MKSYVCVANALITYKYLMTTIVLCRFIVATQLAGLSPIETLQPYVLTCVGSSLVKLFITKGSSLMHETSELAKPEYIELHDYARLALS